MNIFQNNVVSKMSMFHPVFENNYYIRTADLFDNLAVIFYKSWIVVVMRTITDLDHSASVALN